MGVSSCLVAAEHIVSLCSVGACVVLGIIIKEADTPSMKFLEVKIMEGVKYHNGIC